MRTRRRASAFRKSLKSSLAAAPPVLVHRFRMIVKAATLSSTTLA
jgi:hypothetical protein